MPLINVTTKPIDSVTTRPIDELGAPVTYIVHRAEAVAEWGEQRVNRADFHVSSGWEAHWQAETPEEFIEGSRADQSESELSYCGDTIEMLITERGALRL